MMTHWFDHVVVFLFAVVLPVNSYFSYGRFVARVRRGESGVKLRRYLLTTLVQWSLVALAIVAWIVADRPFAQLGFQFPLDRQAWAATAFCFGVAWLYIRLGAAWFRSEEALDRLGKQVEPFADLLPDTRAERNAFVVLSITAGVCEEVLFRGFLLWYLSTAMPIYAAVAISTLAFGLGHAYQGRKGIVKTGVIGLVMCLLYTAGRTLYPLMILHAVIDVVGGVSGYKYIQRRGRGRSQAAAAQA